MFRVKRKKCKKMQKNAKKKKNCREKFKGLNMKVVSER